MSRTTRSSAARPITSGQGRARRIAAVTLTAALLLGVSACGEDGLSVPTSLPGVDLSKITIPTGGDLKKFVDDARSQISTVSGDAEKALAGLKDLKDNVRTQAEDAIGSAQEAVTSTQSALNAARDAKDSAGADLSAATGQLDSALATLDEALKTVESSGKAGDGAKSGLEKLRTELRKLREEVATP